MTCEIWQIFTRAPESAKIGTFVLSTKCLSLKLTVELCLVTMKNDAKFEEKLTFHLKTDLRNLKNFDLNTQEYKKFSL